MSDAHKKFHEFALHSALFKGRTEWYFCYLKSEKIAHVLFALAERGGEKNSSLGELTRGACELPATVAHFAAGELDVSFLLGDIFALLPLVRLCASEGSLSPENSAVLVREYEGIAERIVLGNRPSPFGTAEDFAVPLLLGERSGEPPFLKDTRLPVGIAKGQHKGQKERMSLILEFIKKQKGASIKDITGVIKNCSEKTIQRELSALIRNGLIRKVGERRWSQYLAV